VSQLGALLSGLTVVEDIVVAQNQGEEGTGWSEDRSLAGKRTGRWSAVAAWEDTAAQGYNHLRRDHDHIPPLRDLDTVSLGIGRVLHHNTYVFVLSARASPVCVSRIQKRQLLQLQLLPRSLLHREMIVDDRACFAQGKN